MDLSPLVRSFLPSPALFLGIIASAVAAHGSDWPKWRGPQQNGASSETGWTAQGRAEAVWKVSVGIGYSNVAVADGRLFTMGYDVEAGQDVIACLDAATGVEHWRHAYEADRWNKGHEGGTLSTPVVEGELVYTKNREGKTFCFDAATGEIRWSKNLKVDFETTYGMWGYASSPLVVDNLVILDADKTIALDRGSGSTIWESKPYGQAYATPIDFQHDGTPFLAVFNKTGLVILSRVDGAEVAVHDWPTFNDINAASPIVFEDGRVFISSGANHGCAMLRFTGSALELLWESKVMQNAMNASVLHKGHFYGFDSRILKCIDLDGSEMWIQRGLGLGAMSVAGDNLLVMSDGGELIVVEATPEAYTEVARQQVLEGGVYWTTPVLVDGFIYIRNSLGELVCRDHRTH